MTSLHWVDALPPVTSAGHEGPREITYLFPESSPLDLEPLSPGDEATAELGGRTIRLVKTEHRGLPWHDPETDTSITTYRAAQLGFRKQAA